MQERGASEGTAQVGGACVADDGGSGREDGCEVGIRVERLCVAQ